jgi:hypothetical protein
VGNTGRATSFFDSGTDGGIARGLLKVLQDAGQQVLALLQPLYWRSSQAPVLALLQPLY